MRAALFGQKAVAACCVTPGRLTRSMKTESIATAFTGNYPSVNGPLPGSARMFSTGVRLANFKIYTRTGDTGSSSLYTGERRRKNDVVFEALGTVDELSSAIGMVREFAREELSHTENDDMDTRLHTMQCVLQDIGSFIATPRSNVTSESKLKRTEIDGSIIETLEQWIDQYTAVLPPLTNFILPGGGKTAAAVHVARTICRRAERRVCELFHAGQTEQLPVRILNRFSDYLFTLARYASKRANRCDEIYKKSSGAEKAATASG